MAKKDGLEGIEVKVAGDGIERYRGTAYDKKTGKHLKGPWTTAAAEAKSWRIQTVAGLDAGTLSGDRGALVRDAVAEFIAGIEDGSIVNRSGRPYKPSVVRDYKRDLQRRLARHIGASRLREVELPDLQVVVTRLRRDGLSSSSIRNTMMALRAMYNWALREGYAKVNPCVGLQLPIDDAVVRDRIATPREASLLTAALTGCDRTAFAIAVYAGLRAGELIALDWANVDLERGLISVDPERGAWDEGSGTFIAPKSKAAVRDVPIVARLAAILEDHADQFGRTGLLFPNQADPLADTPMSPTSLLKRLRKRWEAVNDQTRERAAKEGREVDPSELLQPLGLHEGRHTFASMMIDAMKRSHSVNPKALSKVMGHSSIRVTFDRYGHLLPGAENEIRDHLDSYLRAGEDL